MKRGMDLVRDILLKIDHRDGLCHLWTLPETFWFRSSHFFTVTKPPKRAIGDVAQRCSGFHIRHPSWAYLTATNLNSVA